jgi:hypothetical protein
LLRCREMTQWASSDKVHRSKKLVDRLADAGKQSREG